MDGQIYNIGPNPCFNGIWSARASAGASYAPTEGVLILVLMEYGLRGAIRFSLSLGLYSPNPCFNGIWSASLSGW